MDMVWIQILDSFLRLWFVQMTLQTVSQKGSLARPSLEWTNVSNFVE